jgi:hypothetical protein
MAGVEGIEPSHAGFGDRRSTGELHACVGTNWRTRTALTRSTAVCHHPIGLVGVAWWLVRVPPATRDPYEESLHTGARAVCLLVGEDGFEPPTFAFKVRCAANCATRPCWRPVTVTIRLCPLERRVS